MMSTIIAQFFINFGISAIIFLFIIILVAFGIICYQLIFDLINLLFNSISNYPDLWRSLELILLISLFLRFPYFISGEMGIDTFLHNIHSNLFTETGKKGNQQYFFLLTCRK